MLKHFQKSGNHYLAANERRDRKESISPFVFFAFFCGYGFV